MKAMAAGRTTAAIPRVVRRFQATAWRPWRKTQRSPARCGVGINEQGLRYFDGQTWHDMTATARLPSKLFYELYVDPVDGSLWIGSEGGVTRFDGRTWETLTVESVLPATSIYSIVRMREGIYWFGSGEGLTFYRPDRIPPWIAIGGISGAAEQIAASGWEVERDGKIIIGYEAGDLYTPQTELVILYRLSPRGSSVHGSCWTGPFLSYPTSARKAITRSSSRCGTSPSTTLR